MNGQWRVSVVCLVAAAGFSFSAKGAEEKAGIVIPTEALAHSQTDEKTLNEFRNSRMLLRQKLSEVFAENKDDHRWLGRAHIATLQMGEWRFSECVPLLIDHIDWAIDGASVEDKVPQEAYFPCAQALVAIGGKVVRNSILMSIRNRDDDKKLHLMAWVLSKVEGEAFADEMEALAKRKDTIEVVSKRLLKAAEYVRKGTSTFADMDEWAR